MSSPLKKISAAHQAGWAMRAVFVFSLFPSFFFALSCKTMELVRALDSDSRAFYSQVRYIISQEEKKVFLELPSADRAKFIEDFWSRRDSDPDTEENEFKEEYLRRVQTANKLFRGGGKEGFIQDRGRIFILLGPPDEMDTQPMGKFSDAKSYEVWTYQIRYQIQVSFVDINGDGEYTLARPDSRAMQVINSAQARWQDYGSFDQELFDFRLEVKQGEPPLLAIKVPYRYLWFKKVGGVTPEQRVAVNLLVIDSSGKEVWRHQQDYALAGGNEETKKYLGQNASIDIPLALEKGAYYATLTLKDKIGERTQTKRFEFSIE